MSTPQRTCQPCAETTTCPNPCTTVHLDCTDILSIIVQSILNLGAASTAADILVEAQTVCPTAGVTAETLDAGLTWAAKRGIVFRRIAAQGATPQFLVNARMAELNVANKKYNRPPCQQTSFFVPQT